VDADAALPLARELGIDHVSPLGSKSKTAIHRKVAPPMAPPYGKGKIVLTNA